MFQCRSALFFFCLFGLINFVDSPILQRAHADAAKAKPPAAAADVKATQAKRKSRVNGMARVTMVQSASVHRSKPPLKDIYLDVTLQNDNASPRWFLLPQALPACVHRREGGVNHLEVFRPPGVGKVVIIDLMGTNQYGWACLLPAKSRVTIKNLEIQDWDDTLPKELNIKSVVTREVKLNGKPLATFLKQDPTCDAKGEVSFGKIRADSIIESHRLSEDNSEIPIQYTAEETLRFSVPIKENL